VLWSKGKVVSILPLLDTAPEPLPTLPAGKATIRRCSKGALVAERQGIIRATANGEFLPENRGRDHRMAAWPRDCRR
ncbi:hypothetical protein, partial [Enterovirga rhinocerotis]